jgi:flavin reductase (DIM6/NTAB) family NADH-FMN oxidoreductase RutF
MTTLAAHRTLAPDRLRRAYGMFPSGVVAVAAEVEGRYVGLAASSFTSVSIDPPLVSFAIANTSKTWVDLRRASHLGISVLADCHGAVAQQLAGPAENRLDRVAATVSAGGAITLDEALARFDTTIYREVEAGDHTIVLLELHAIRHDPHSLPLIFHRSRFGLRDQTEGGVEAQASA